MIKDFEPIPFEYRKPTRREVKWALGEDPDMMADQALEIKMNTGPKLLKEVEKEMGFFRLDEPRLWMDENDRYW